MMSQEELMFVVDKQSTNIQKGLEFFTIHPDRSPGALGDKRWTDELILATWEQAATGRPPISDIEYKVGLSGGGFDLLDFKFPHDTAPLASNTPIDISISLNKRSEGPKITISQP